MTTLVTGGHGLVGHALQSLNSTFLYPTHEELDLLSWSQVGAYFKLHRPERVIHLAANEGNEVEMLEDNLLINLHVLRAAHQYGVKRLVAVLSTCVFPDQVEYPLTEEKLHLGPPHISNDGYAYAKRILEVECRKYREQYGDDFVTIIPTNLFGPHDNFSLTDSDVIPALIHKCYLAKQEDKPFVVAGSGRHLRQFLFSGDLARVLIWALDPSHKFTSLIVAPEQEYSIGQIAQLIAIHFGYAHHLVYDSSQPDEQYRTPASAVKLQELWPEFEYSFITRNIDCTITWFLQMYPHIRGI